MSAKHPVFEHAVVLGGSIGGLAAASVLSAHFRKVTVIERDPMPDGPEPRKGAPQMAHVHAFLEPAIKILRSRFDGIIDDLIRDGAMKTDPGLRAAWYHYGGWKPSFKSGIEGILCSRPLIEHHVRRRVSAIANVEIRYEVTAEELLGDASKERITGVLLTARGEKEEVMADLVLDASGRGTRAPRWLDSLGYGRPEEEQVKIDLAYTSRLYEIPKERSADWRFLAVYSAPPGRRSGFVVEVEGGRWIASLNGYFKDHAPTDDEGFLEFARSLPVPQIYDALKDAKPISPLRAHKIPSSRWFHYERMKRFPERLMLLGDSVCSLNPVYAQGTTVALQCAKALEETLETALSRGEGLDGLGKKLQKRVARVVMEPWLMSTTMDLRFPEAEGRRAPGLALAQRAFANLIDLSSVDADVCRVFYEIMHQRKSALALLSPGVLFPFLAYSAKSVLVPQDARVNKTMPSD